MNNNTNPFSGNLKESKIDASADCCIVIPIYKSTLTAHDIISLKRCLLVLPTYSVNFVYPIGMDITLYKHLTAESNQINFISFDPEYFANIAGYNRLMLSTELYQKFTDFKYMLIYQLDCYIFVDNLKYWCVKGYDYVGAPWIDWEWCTFYAHHITFPRRLLYKLGFRKFNLVGNGGFSLRKIGPTIRNLNFFQRQVKKFTLNEDFFFSYYINSFNPFFKVAPFKEALNFSFDENPEKLYLSNNSKLPMACHAWPKYIEFWETHLSIDKLS